MDCCYTLTACGSERVVRWCCCHAGAQVVVVAFGRAGGSGSFALRSLAARQKDMLTVTRGHVQVRGGRTCR